MRWEEEMEVKETVMMIVKIVGSVALDTTAVVTGIGQKTEVIIGVRTDETEIEIESEEVQAMVVVKVAIEVLTETETKTSGVIVIARKTERRIAREIDMRALRTQWPNLGHLIMRGGI
jgi:hypothetical protein